MQRLQRGVWNSNRPAILVGALFLLVAGVLLVMHTSLFAGNNQKQNVASIKDVTVTSDAIPLNKTTPSATSGIPSDAESNTSSLKDATPQNVTDNTPSTSSNPCDNVIAQALRSYNRDVKKQKSLLDNTLSFKVGLNISSQYVADYNNKVNDIFAEYLNEAKSENCTWPVATAPILPETYAP